MQINLRILIKVAKYTRTYIIVFRNEDGSVFEYNIDSADLNVDDLQKFMHDINHEKKTTFTEKNATMTYNDFSNYINIKNQNTLFTFKNCYDFMRVLKEIIEDNKKQ